MSNTSVQRSSETSDPSDLTVYRSQWHIHRGPSRHQNHRLVAIEERLHNYHLKNKIPSVVVHNKNVSTDIYLHNTEHK